MKRNSFLLKATTALVIALTALPVVSHAEAYDPNDDYQQLDVKFYENQKPDQGFYINAAANYMLETVENPTVGSVGGGGSGAGVNAMATDQALYGLIAYDRYKNGENSLYDMTDAQENYTAKQFSLTYVENGNSATEHYSPYAAVNLKDTVERWNTKADGTGTSYVATDTLSMPEENITLYAE